PEQPRVGRRVRSDPVERVLHAHREGRRRQGSRRVVRRPGRLGPQQVGEGTDEKMTQTTVRPTRASQRRAKTAQPMSRKVKSTGRRITPWMLLAPATIMVALALGYPLVRQAIMSFQHFGLAQQFGQPAEWAGLSNYTTILTDPYFWSVFLKSVAFCAWTAGITMVLGVAVAVLMLRLNTVVRTILNTTLIIVWAMPLLAALTVWQWLVDPRSGLLNFFLTGVGLEGFENFNWLGG